MSLDALTAQLSTALQRLAVLQRRAETNSAQPRLLQQTLKELEGALEELQVAREQLVEQANELAEARVSLDRERRKYWQLFDTAPDAHVLTSDDLLITEANRAAAELLNISQRFLVGKPLSVFVCEDRGRLVTDAQELALRGGAAEWVIRIRPRERAPLIVDAWVATNDEPAHSLRWTIRRVPVTMGVAAAK